MTIILFKNWLDCFQNYITQLPVWCVLLLLDNFAVHGQLVKLPQCDNVEKYLLRLNSASRVQNLDLISALKLHYKLIHMQWALGNIEAPLSDFQKVYIPTAMCWARDTWNYVSTQLI